MTQHEIYDIYLQWLGDCKPNVFSDPFQTPFAHFDVFEDEERLVNRLFYIAPTFSDALLRCLIFFEENEFRKNEQGDLILAHSSWHIQDT